MSTLFHYYYPLFPFSGSFFSGRRALRTLGGFVLCRCSLSSRTAVACFARSIYQALFFFLWSDLGMETGKGSVFVVALLEKAAFVHGMHVLIA